MFFTDPPPLCVWYRISMLMVSVACCSDAAWQGCSSFLHLAVAAMHKALSGDSPLKHRQSPAPTIVISSSMASSVDVEIIVTAA